MTRFDITEFDGQPIIHDLWRAEFNALVPWWQRRFVLWRLRRNMLRWMRRG